MQGQWLPAMACSVEMLSQRTALALANESRIRVYGHTTIAPLLYLRIPGSSYINVYYYLALGCAVLHAF